MAGKGKKKVKDEVPEGTDLSMLTEEEAKVLEEEIEEEGEPEGKPDEKPNEKPKEKPEEKPDEKKEGDEKGEEEGKPKGKDKDDEDGEPEPKKGDEEGDRGGDEDDPLKDAKPVTLEIDGEKVAGWIAKSGKYIISYADVEKRDAARRTLRATNEVLTSQVNALKSNLEALKAENETLKTGAGKPDGSQEQGLVDVKALAAKVAQGVYSSEEDAQTALEEVLTAIFNAGKKAGAASGDQVEGPDGQQIQSKVLTPEEQQRQIEVSVAWQKTVEELIDQYPVLKDPKVEFFCYNNALRIIGNKIKDMDEAGQAAWVMVTDNIKAATEEAAKETVAMLQGPEKSPEEAAAEKQRQEDELLESVATRLNLNPEQIRTLGDSGGPVEPEKARTKELDNLQGPDLEEAMDKMTPEEREKYLDSPTDE